MTDAAPGSVMGDDCKAYYSASLAASNGTWSGSLTEIPLTVEDTIAREFRTAESNCRGDAEVSEHVGKIKFAPSGVLLFKRGTPGATYATLKAAALARTPLHFAFATGDITHIGNHVIRLEARFKKWEESRPEGDVIKVSYELARNPDSYYPTTESVVAA